MKPVYLLGCVAEVADSRGHFGPGKPPQVSLMGLFDVEEFCPYEPSAYVWSPYFLVCSHYDQRDYPQYYAVPAQDFEQQVHPDSYAREVELEREQGFYEEDRMREEDEALL